MRVNLRKINNLDFKRWKSVMKKYEITYYLFPDAENITFTFLAKTEEEAINFAKQYRKEAFRIEEKGEVT